MKGGLVTVVIPLDGRLVSTPKFVNVISEEYCNTEFLNSYNRCIY